ncbi:Protein CBG21445 [Caenorhabditis briggsae]|uniref:Protein CBG21445 n=1 Tax=Caenorhabditis briggsae TaxID=6238 RepID=A8Y025_CAEBR|nr:Protein CBG21445 [Caenorhabditis briggsae]CAP38243.2 Protein CBG21445 [Caenorhabditis briggsae]
MNKTAIICYLQTKVTQKFKTWGNMENIYSKRERTPRNVFMHKCDGKSRIHTNYILRIFSKNREKSHSKSSSSVFGMRGNRRNFASWLHFIEWRTLEDEYLDDGKLEVEVHILLLHGFVFLEASRSCCDHAHEPRTRNGMDIVDNLYRESWQLYLRLVQHNYGFFNRVRAMSLQNQRNQQKRETFWMDHIPESTDNCMETHSSSFWSRRVDGALKKASGKQRILGHQTASILIHPPPENVGYCLHAIRAQAHEMIVFTKESPEMKIPTLFQNIGLQYIFSKDWSDVAANPIKMGSCASQNSHRRASSAEIGRPPAATWQPMVHGSLQW